MKRGLKIFVLVMLGVVAVMNSPRIAPACGPFFPQTIFTNTLHPDLPIGPYTRGNLGIIEPGYARIYLYVAYRNLSGMRFTPKEVLALWSRAPYLLGYKIQEGNRVRWVGEKIQEIEPVTSAKSWLVERAKVAGVTPAAYQNLIPSESGGIYRQVTRKNAQWTYYSQYLNCPADAFREADSTLANMIKEFGISSPVVQSWVEAQDQVFTNCAQGPAIPAPLPSSSPALARADRAYQIAAALFYAGSYDQAVSDFRHIAADTSSPWSTIAPYLVARALIRKATVGCDDDKPDLATLAHAETQLRSVLRNPQLAEYHQAAAKLLGYVEIRLHPEERLIALAEALMKPSDPNLAQDATDYTFLLDRLEAEQAFMNPQTHLQDRRLEYSGLSDLRRHNDLIDWTLTFQLQSPEALTHAVEKWQSTRSLPWLVAALTKMAPNDPHAPELLVAAEEVPPASPGYVAVTFQRMRLMLLAGSKTAVRGQLDSLLRARAAHMPRSALNLFLALRLELAQNFNEFLRYAPRVPAEMTADFDEFEMPVDFKTWIAPYNSLNPTALRFDADSLVVLNRILPVNMLAEAARSRLLPQSLRRETALATWTRAALLGESREARALAPEIDSMVPQLKPELRAYDSATTPAARRFAAVLTMLRYPGLRPYITTERRLTPVGKLDMVRDNWWDRGGPCGIGKYKIYNSLFEPFGYRSVWPQLSPTLKAIYPGGVAGLPAFLTARAQADGQSEWAKLQSLGTVPNYLSGVVIAWAKTHPRDSRVPEALALAVKSTRVGCEDQNTWKFSKEAFELLHRCYPGTSWAKATKYWYKM